MGNSEANHFTFLEPTFRRTLRIWCGWFWRFALLGGVPIVLAGLADYYNHHSSEPFALVPLAAFLTLVVAPFWAYTYSFRVLFEKTFDGIRIRLQPVSQPGSASQPEIFLAPTKGLTRKIRKKWAQRSWRWGLGFVVTLLLFGACVADGRLKRSDPNSAESLIALFLINVLFFGTPLGWLAGSAWELKSIFKGDFGEFKVCLTWEPDPRQQK